MPFRFGEPDGQIIDRLAPQNSRLGTRYHHNVQVFRAVDTQVEDLLDVGRPARTGDYNQIARVDRRGWVSRNPVGEARHDVLRTLLQFESLQLPRCMHLLNVCIYQRVQF